MSDDTKAEATQTELGAEAAIEEHQLDTKEEFVGVDPASFFEKASKDIATEDTLSDAVKWDPEPNEVLKLEFYKAETWHSDKYNNTSIILYGFNVEKDREMTKVWASRTVLKNELIDAAPRKGSLLMIQFLGKAKTRDGSTEFYKYAARAQHSDIKYWDQVLAGKTRPEITPEGDWVDNPNAPSSVADPGPDEDPF